MCRGGQFQVVAEQVAARKLVVASNLAFEDAAADQFNEFYGRANLALKLWSETNQIFGSFYMSQAAKRPEARGGKKWLHKSPNSDDTIID